MNEVVFEYFDVVVDYLYVDVVIIFLVIDFLCFDVIVIDNFFGDIFIDFVGVVMGGIGFVVFGNINFDGNFLLMFEFVYGLVLDIVG